MARPNGRKGRQTSEGKAEPRMTRGYLERTKAMIDAAYEVWRIKNKIPKYSHWEIHAANRRAGTPVV